MSENLPAPENLLDAERIQMIKNFRKELTGFMLNYQFGIDEILTKINILKTNSASCTNTHLSSTYLHD